jgi:ADP-dependent NAD(P)H-hydrate dehydratase / NAD(P)H-hydrate epimerase
VDTASIIHPMSDTSSFIYTPDRVRELDRIAIEELGIPGYELMTRAGHVVYALACERYPEARHWLLLCGAGNNAGDGYVVARLAIAAGRSVTVAALSDPHRLEGDAARAWQEFQLGGGSVVPFTEALCAGADLVIDALLGTGLARALEGAYLHAVESVNACQAPVIAVDIPSGLSGATGRVHGAAVEAQITATFIGRKQGLYTGAGPDHAGEIVFTDLGVPLEKISDVPPQLRLYDGADHVRMLPRRARTANKGNFGHVLVIGGNSGMGGSVRLAGEAALRAGAGLVSVVTRPENVVAVTSGCPELMCVGTTGPADLGPLLARATVIAIGPGLGQDAWARGLLDRVLELPQLLVADADALNLIAGQPRRRDLWVLTPHPGEAGRLLGLSTAEVQSDRIGATAGLCARYGGVVVLKGRCTLVGQAGQLPYVIGAGNPGMASAGMGDVLTGLIAGVLAQRRPSDLLQATACAAYVHARAADDAAAAGERGLIAGDLFPRLRSWLNPAQ